MTFSEFCKVTRDGLIQPPAARTVYLLVKQELSSREKEIETQLDLQDMIYSRTHDLKMSGYASNIWACYNKTKVIKEWNDDTSFKE